MGMPDWDAVIRPHVAGRCVILAGGPVAQWTERIRELRRLGSGPIFVFATGSVGTGPLPGPDECEWLVVDTPTAPTLIERIRLGNAVLADPPAGAVERLDAFDPDRTALVIGDFLNAAPTLAGRPFLAHRHAEWVALEDKVTVDALWDRAGVERAPCEIVAATTDAVRSAAARVDAGDGVVVAGDARQGWHGGASLVRWADSPDLLEAAVDALSGQCDSVRVMPYLHGIPCSIHGIVLPDGVAVVRPVEMVVMRRPDGRFFYAGCATFYDPPATVRETLRAAARRVGEQLRAEVGFRGAFTVDGVATAGGFRPTELNPRSGAGLTVVARATGLPIQLLLDLVVAGEPVGMTCDDLEHVIVELADGQRAGGTWSPISGVEAEPTELALTCGATGFTEAGPADPVDAMLTLGVGHGGIFVRTMFDPASTPRGPSVGARACAVWQFADHRFGLGIGPLAIAEETSAT